MSLLVCILFLMSCTQTEPETFSPPTTPQTTHQFGSYHHLQRTEISQVIISGPVKALDICIAGRSIFEPVVMSPNLTDEEMTNLVFQFMCKHFHSWNLRQGIDLRAMLYGTNFGLCGEQSLVMCGLWNCYGITARTVSFPRHVVAEAYFAGQWHLYDAQHKIDFSALVGRPFSSDMISDTNLKNLAEIDRIGYSSSYFRKILTEKTPDIYKVQAPIKNPVFNLSEGQFLTIEPRYTISKRTLPLSEKPDTQARTDVLPLYWLTITQKEFQGNDEIRFFTGLPVIDLVGDEEASFQVSIQGSSYKNKNLRSLRQKMKGKTDTLIVKGPLESNLSVVYSLANWVGDRIFRGKNGQNLDFFAQSDSSLVINYKEQKSHVWIDSLTCLSKSIHNSKVTVNLHLCWENMPRENERTYHIFLDELSSALPLEVWQFIDNVSWKYNPQIHPAQGSKIIRFEWNLSPHSAPYHSSKERTLLARIKGPDIQSGHNWIRKNIILH